MHVFIKLSRESISSSVLLLVAVGEGIDIHERRRRASKCACLP